MTSRPVAATAAAAFILAAALSSDEEGAVVSVEEGPALSDGENCN